MGPDLLHVRPGSALTRAVLAVSRFDRTLLVVQNNRYDLPVAFVCLPGESTRGILEAPEVVGVEIPVLEDDRAGAHFVAAVDDTRAICASGVTRDGCESARRRAATIVEPPSVALHGQAGRRKLGRVIKPVVAKLL